MYLFSGQGVEHGDSGAGLNYKHGSSYFITGIVSTKITESSNSVAVFTDVRKHIEWIRSLYEKNVKKSKREVYNFF